jgi:putative endonuclease
MRLALSNLLRGPHRGRPGEDLACRHLAESGFTVLQRNYRCRSGEVDVVARDGEITVFVEVKERRGASHGHGYESVTFGKRRRLIRAARLFAAAHGLDERPLRFDVISIDWDAEGPHLRHDRGAFDLSGG